MSYRHRRILCAYLLTVVLGSAWANAQDQPPQEELPEAGAAQVQPVQEVPAVIITPSGEAPEVRPAPADTDQPFELLPSARSVFAVPRLLAQNKDYQKGDLLTWELVKPVLDRLRRAKVPMPPEKELKPRFLSANDPLVRMFRTKDGKAFFQKLAENPASIDMVDHYRTLPYGNQFLNEFIHDVDGYKFFTTRTWMDADDAKWAETHTLANVPGGKTFGEPTGRIYLETQLVEFLASYKKSATTRSYE